MICRKCGEILDDNAKVCAACGARVKDAGETVLNPTHIGDADCAHEEAHKPRKRSTKGFRFPLILLPFLFFLGNTLLLSIPGELGQKLVSIFVVVFMVFALVVSVLSRRK